MTTQVAPTTRDDVGAFFPQASPWRIRALTASVDGKIIGIGGIAHHYDGSMVAFIEASEADCKRYPVTLHKAALRALKEWRALGIKRVFAKVDTSREAAGRWLLRLGFRRAGQIDGQDGYLWQPSD